MAEFHLELDMLRSFFQAPNFLSGTFYRHQAAERKGIDEQKGRAGDHRLAHFIADKLVIALQ